MMSEPMMLYTGAPETKDPRADRADRAAAVSTDDLRLGSTLALPAHAFSAPFDPALFIEDDAYPKLLDDLNWVRTEADRLLAQVDNAVAEDH